MSSETTMMAEQCRLQEWAAQIRDCQNRPDGMSIVSWCACHGITKANFNFLHSYPSFCAELSKYRSLLEFTLIQHICTLVIIFS